jgi:hypothetical protein
MYFSSQLVNKRYEQQTYFSLLFLHIEPRSDGITPIVNSCYEYLYTIDIIEIDSGC